MAKRAVDVFATLSSEARGRLRARAQPSWLDPMLATLTQRHFSSPDWIYEHKLDGVRCLAYRRGERVRLLSRNRKDMNRRWPELVEAIAGQEHDAFIVDGEIVAFDPSDHGRTSFARLQNRIGISDPDAVRRSGVAVYLYLFDLMYLDGHDTTRLPLLSRKALLKAAFSFQGRLRYSHHRKEHGEKFLEEACRKGWEGLIAKRADSPYVHGRSRDWLKFKCSNRQEFVIGGYTEPKGARVGFGALLVGYYDDGELKYAGKVGTGYDDELLRRLSRRLKSIERAKSPFCDDIRERGAHWVSPMLVGDVAFAEWTGAGRLRHPRFVGLRADKKPKDVVRERPT